MLRRSTNLVILSFLLDVASVVGAVGLARWLRVEMPFGLPLPDPHHLFTLLWEAALLYPVVFFLFSLYDPERTYHAVDEYQLLSIASLIAALGLAGLVFFTARDISRLFLLYFYGSHFTLVTLWRAVVRLGRRSLNGHTPDRRRVLLIGGGEAAQRALERLDDLAWAGVSLVGYLTDGEPIPNAGEDVPLLGGVDDVVRVVGERGIDDVLVALPAESYTKVNELVARLIDQPCSVWVVPDYFSLLIYGGHVESLGGVPMISLKMPTLTGYQRLVKRVFDLVVGTLMQIALAPGMLVIAIAIKLDSPGPVIFKQKRVGENGRLFWMYKFRTMVKDADSRLTEVMKADADGNLVHKRPDDPRVTRVGRILRKLSADEWPNLFNVLKGEMSLVGPRPEMPILVEQYAPWQRVRFAVPQGITGWWQVNGRSDKPMHLNTEDDIYYVRNYSLLLDLQILYKTVWVVLRGKGAY
ncbi:MAG: sugar transferase [Anaerolineales bacterium]|nr:sugar transferase [Anaerolineales bacterium]